MYLVLNEISRFSLTKKSSETIISLKAFLTTIISRLCLQHLHLVRRKREEYPGPWLPEPMLTTEDSERIVGNSEKLTHV